MAAQVEYYKPKPGATYRILPLPTSAERLLFSYQFRKTKTYVKCPELDCPLCAIFEYQRALDSWENEGGAL